MTRHIFRVALLLSVFALGSAPAGAATSVIPVTLSTIRGLPADSLDRGRFIAAFRAAMDADLPAEALAGGVWSSAGTRRNPFRLMDAASPEEAWLVEVSVGLPPPVRVIRPQPRGGKTAPTVHLTNVRASRGLTVAVAVTAPPGAPNYGVDGDTLPQAVAVYFADARRVVVPTTKLPGGAYDYPWADAGRVVARLVLEALDRARGAMDDNTRADLTPATRATAADVTP